MNVKKKGEVVMCVRAATVRDARNIATVHVATTTVSQNFETSVLRDS